MRNVESISSFSRTHEFFSSQMLTDPDSLDLLGGEILHVIRAPEILHRLTEDHFNGEATYIPQQTRRVRQPFSEKTFLPKFKVINFCSLVWPTSLTNESTAGTQSVSIVVSDAELLSYYIGDGDPSEDDYSNKLIDNVKRRSSYELDYDDTKYNGVINDLWPMVINQTIFNASPVVSDTQEWLYESIADDLVGFYSRYS